MPDESTEGQQATVETATQQAEPKPVDYNAVLDQIPDDVLTRHARISGVVGKHAQRLAERERTRLEQEARDRALRDKEAELLKLAQENPFEFSQRYLKDYETSRAQLEIQGLRTNVQKDLFERVASSYAAHPEWRELTPDEFSRVQQAVAGKSDEELVAAFNVAALDVLAERRASKRAEASLKDRMSAEVEAQVQQRLAERLGSERAPDMTAPSSAIGRFDPRNLSDEDFDRWYKQQILR